MKQIFLINSRLILHMSTQKNALRSDVSTMASPSTTIWLALLLSHTATTVANIPCLPLSLSLPLLSFAVYFNKPWHQHQQHFVLKQTLWKAGVLDLLLRYVFLFVCLLFDVFINMFLFSNLLIREDDDRLYMLLCRWLYICNLNSHISCLFSSHNINSNIESWSSRIIRTTQTISVWWCTSKWWYVTNIELIS